MGAAFDLRVKLSIFWPIASVFKSPFARDSGVFAAVLAWLKEALA